eukprot:5420589-Pyramimonas_sp.AAC.1
MLYYNTSDHRRGPVRGLSRRGPEGHNVVSPPLPPALSSPLGRGSPPRRRGRPRVGRARG